MDFSSLRSFHGRELDRVGPRVKSGSSRSTYSLKKLLQCLCGGLIQEATKNFQVLVADLKGRSITCGGNACWRWSNALLGPLMKLSRNMDILYRSQPLVSSRKRLAKNRETNSVLGPGAQGVI